MSTEAPTFTVILNHYNDSPYLKAALDRVLEQDEPPDQVIVVDDGSDRAEREAFDAVVASFSGIEVIRHPENLGVVAAGNSALAIARGDYVAWWSVDDRVAPGLLSEARAAVAAYPGAGAIATETRVEDETPAGPVFAYEHRFGLGRAHLYLTGSQFAALQRRRYIWLASSGAFLKRDCLEQGIGWSATLDWLTDWAALYAAAYRDGVVLIGKPMSTVLQRPGSFGTAARADRDRARSAIRALLDTLSRAGNSDIRACLSTGPLALSYALGSAFYSASLSRPGDWSLALRTCLTAFMHRIRIRVAGRVPDISELLDPSVFRDGSG